MSRPRQTIGGPRHSWRRKLRHLTGGFTVSVWCFIAGVMIAGYGTKPALGIVFALLGCAVWLARAVDRLEDIYAEALRHDEAILRRIMEMYAGVCDMDRIMLRLEREKMSKPDEGRK